MCASDAYGRSKAAAEAALEDWNAPGVVKAIVRLPLVVGKDAPGNFGRMVAAIRRGRYVNIAGGHARRSFVWIDDVARFIQRLASDGKGGTYNLTDGADATFADLSEALCRLLGRKRPLSLPFSVARQLALAGDALGRVTGRRVPFDSNVLRKMTSELTFSCNKAVRDLEWNPTPVLDRMKDVI
jgi:nucleoside-diphosphate-sugar epimerase